MKRSRLLLISLRVRLPLEGGHSGAHDLVDEEQVGGDDGRRVDHLPLHVVVVQDAVLGRRDGLPRRAIDPHRGARVLGIGQQLDDRLLSVVP